MAVRYRDVDEVLRLHLLEVGEGVGLRDRNLLEAAIERPRQSAFGEDAYPTLESKIAALLDYLHAITRSSTATSESPCSPHLCSSNSMGSKSRQQTTRSSRLSSHSSFERSTLTALSIESGPGCDLDVATEFQRLGSTASEFRAFVGLSAAVSRRCQSRRCARQVGGLARPRRRCLRSGSRRLRQ